MLARACWPPAGRGADAAAAGAAPSTRARDARGRRRRRSCSASPSRSAALVGGRGRTARSPIAPARPRARAGASPRAAPRRPRAATSRRSRAARAAAWTALLARRASRSTLAARPAGDADDARAVAARARVPDADPVLAGRRRRDARARGARPRPDHPGRGRRAVRADLLDTYQARLRASLEARTRRPAAASTPALAERGRARPRLLRRSLAAGLRGAAGAAAPRARSTARSARLDRPPRPARRGGAASGRRAAPRGLPGRTARRPTSRLRRAGQLDRFLRLVPIEYGRGVDDGRVTLDFEIQEAITFRDGAAQAFARPRADAARGATRPRPRELGARISSRLGDDLDASRRGDARSLDPDASAATTDQALELIDGALPGGVEGGGRDAPTST